MKIVQVGLLLDIIGVIIIFYYGLPQNVQKQNGYVESGELTIEQIKENKIMRNKAIFGLVFVVIGFLLQIISTIN